MNRNEITVDVSDIEIPRYIEVFDTAMHNKEYFSTLQEAAVYMKTTVSKIADALCSDVEVRLNGRYRVDIITDLEEEDDLYEQHVDIMFKDYRTDECLIVSSIKDAKRKTGIDEAIISRHLESDDDVLVGEFVFRKASVKTIRPWPVFTSEQLLTGRSMYLVELKKYACPFRKRHLEIDRLLKTFLKEHYLELRTDKDLTDDQRKHYLPLFDKGFGMFYDIDVQLLVQHAKGKVREMKRELVHGLDDIDREYEKDLEIEYEL